MENGTGVHETDGGGIRSRVSARADRLCLVDEGDIERALEQTQAANRQAPAGNLAGSDQARKGREAEA